MIEYKEEEEKEKNPSEKMSIILPNLEKSEIQSNLINNHLLYGYQTEFELLIDFEGLVSVGEDAINNVFNFFFFYFNETNFQHINEEQLNFVLKYYYNLLTNYFPNITNIFKTQLIQFLDCFKTEILPKHVFNADSQLHVIFSKFTLKLLDKYTMVCPDLFIDQFDRDIIMKFCDFSPWHFTLMLQMIINAYQSLNYRHFSYFKDAFSEFLSYFKSQTNEQNPLFFDYINEDKHDPESFSSPQTLILLLLSFSYNTFKIINLSEANTIIHNEMFSSIHWSFTNILTIFGDFEVEALLLNIVDISDTHYSLIYQTIINESKTEDESEIQDEPNFQLTYKQKKMFFDILFETGFIGLLKSHNFDQFWFLLTYCLEIISQNVDCKIGQGLGLIHFLQYYEQSYILIPNPKIAEKSYECLKEIEDWVDEIDGLDRAQEKVLQDLVSSLLERFHK